MSMSAAQVSKSLPVWAAYRAGDGLFDEMLDLARVTSQDYLIDLGSGDGRIVIAAAKRGARALGIEYNPDMVELSKANAAKEGVSNLATFRKADLFETDFSKATVITMFLLSDINLRLRPKLLEMKPGTRVVSDSFDMEDWAADETATVDEGCNTWCTALLWIAASGARRRQVSRRVYGQKYGRSARHHYADACRNGHAARASTGACRLE